MCMVLRSGLLEVLSPLSMGTGECGCAGSWISERIGKEKECV